MNNPLYKEQVKQFLRFFRTKRELQLQEIEQIFNDVRCAELRDGEMYNAEDLETIMTGLMDNVKSNYRNDLQLTVNMSVLAIQQLFEEADAQEVELEMDISRIEDAALIQEVDKIHIDAPTENRRKTGKLVSLRDEQQRIAEENTIVKKENQKLRQQLEKLQDKLIGSNTRLSNLAMEVETLRQKALSPSVPNGPASQEAKSNTESKQATGPLTPPTAQNIFEMQKMLDDDRDTTSQLQAELDDAKSLLLMQGKDLDEFTSKIVNSRQFRQLKKMVQTKNEQLADLRSKMLHYEPDSTMLADDTANIPLQRHK